MIKNLKRKKQRQWKYASIDKCDLCGEEECSGEWITGILHYIVSDCKPESYAILPDDLKEMMEIEVCSKE